MVFAMSVGKDTWGARRAKDLGASLVTGDNLERSIVP